MDPKKTTPQMYTADDIKKFDEVEMIRRRHGMYVGDRDTPAHYLLVYGVIDGTVDQALAGHCDSIIVTLHDDNMVSVNDNGPGFPIAWAVWDKMSWLEKYLTQMFVPGGAFDVAYSTSNHSAFVDLLHVNALSSLLIAEVRRDGHLWRQAFSEGKRTSDLIRVRALEPGEATGTKITFRPDFTILEPNEFSFATLAQRLREIAFLVPRLTITLRDERVKPIANETTFHFEKGLRSFVSYVNRDRKTLHSVIYGQRNFEMGPVSGILYPIAVEVAFPYTDTDTITDLGFANIGSTPDGGTHLAGLRTAISEVMNHYARQMGLLKEVDSPLSESDALAGLTAIVSIQHPRPRCESQTILKLTNPELTEMVAQVVTERFNEFLDHNPDDARRIVGNCLARRRTSLNP